MVKESTIAYDFVGGQVSSDGVERLKHGGNLVFGALGRTVLGRPELEKMPSRINRSNGFALSSISHPTIFKPI